MVRIVAHNGDQPCDTQEAGMAVQKEAFHQASPTEAFLMNCWYVAAWDHELIDGRSCSRARSSTSRWCCTRATAARRWRWTTAAAIAAPSSRTGRREGDCVRCMYHGLEVRRDRQVRADPRAGQHPAQARRAQLSGGRARPPGLDLDGRCGEGGSGEDPRFPVPARSGLARASRLHALRRELPADRRQPVATSRTSPSCTPKTLGGSEEYAFKSKPTAIERLDDGFRVERWHMNAPPPPFHKKVVRDARRSRPAQHRPHARAGHLLHGDAVLAGRLRRGEGATSRARSSTATASSSRPRPRAARTSSGTTCTTTTCTIRTSRCRSTTAWWMASSEDKAIIEAQQKTLEADPAFQMNGDRRRMRRWCISAARSARMIDAERAGPKAVRCLTVYSHVTVGTQPCAPPRGSMTR